MEINKTMLYRYWQPHNSYKTEGVYTDIAGDGEARFDTSDYEIQRHLSMWKNKKSNRFDERWIMWQNNGRVCTPNSFYTHYLTDEGHVDKKANCTKKCVIKREIRIREQDKRIQASDGVITSIWQCIGWI